MPNVTGSNTAKSNATRPNAAESNPLDAATTGRAPKSSRTTAGKLTYLVVSAIVTANILPWGTTPARGADDGFSSVLTSRTRQTFVAISGYVADSPDSPDAVAAAHWIMQTAREFGWQADAGPAVDLVLAQSPPDPELQRLAWITRAIGAAQQGDAATSSAAYRDFLRSLRLRQPNLAADVAQSIATAWQLRGEVDAAASVYDQLLSGFLLNEELRQFADARRQRLKLVGKPVPEIPELDLQGNAVRWSDWQERVVLLDFWATNCRPCLEEFPRLKRRHAELSPTGADILGISFDSEPETVTQFLEQQPLPWRQVLARTTAESAFAVHLLPCMMLVNGKGEIAVVDLRPEDVRWAITSLQSKSAQTP